MLCTNELIIDNITFNIFYNLKHQYINISTSEQSNEFYDNEIKSNNINYYFLLETPMHSAFSHWIYESAIFLPYFNKIKQILGQNIKILTIKEPKRTYKKLFFNIFNIKEDNIYYINSFENSKHKFCYYNIPKNNICITCPNYCLNTKVFSNAELFTTLVLNFRENILKSYNFDYIKNNEYLFFPRNSSENFIPNDREINYTKVYNILNNKEYIKYDTMNTTKFKDQIQLLISSQNIFLDGGSSLWVNGLFCENSTIYVSKWLSQNLYQCWDILKNIMEKNNNKIIILY